MVCKNTLFNLTFDPESWENAPETWNECKEMITQMFIPISLHIGGNLHSDLSCITYTVSPDSTSEVRHGPNELHLDKEP